MSLVFALGQMSILFFQAQSAKCRSHRRVAVAAHLAMSTPATPALSPAEAELIERYEQAAPEPLPARERAVELSLAALVIAAGVVIAQSFHAERQFHLGTTVAFLVAYLVAKRIKFAVGAGYTIPTQVVFVPMLFALPAALVPLLVATALTVSRIPAVLWRGLPASRLLCMPSNSWFAVGPSLVFVLTGTHHPEGHYPILLAALFAQFALDFAANAARERVSGGVALPTLAQETRWIYLVDAALAPVGLAVAFATTAHSWAVLLIAPLLGLLRVFSNERRARLEQLIELNDAYRGTALVLGDVVEADDTYTGEHCRGVVRLALEVAQELELDALRRRTVEFGALLHDVGKIAVPKKIINKPGKLDEREWAVIKAHTIEGQRMLDRVGGMMREVGQVVRSSHEWWDGSGYPDGLAGEQIPLESRIVSACDAFNAMTTTRPYRRAMSKADALAELLRSAGSQFDPQVVAAVIRVVA
jgi:putative nucleotidyltransferase with HDIG domain